MSLELRFYPDKILKQKLEPIPSVTADIKKLVQEMKLTMYDEIGIGLAANQVGELVRILVVDPAAGSDQSKFRAVINPVLKSTFGESVEMEEGCLSFPEMREIVERPDGVEMDYLDENGEPHSVREIGLMSRVLQHEYDHLEGMTILDRISGVRRVLLTKKLRELRKASQAK